MRTLLFLSLLAGLLAACAGTRFERNNLQVGMVAPEIRGLDLEGQAFKLSDYRGKVVVLDESGKIRFKNVRGEVMDEAVDQLLAEME